MEVIPDNLLFDTMMLFKLHCINEIFMANKTNSLPHIQEQDKNDILKDKLGVKEGELPVIRVAPIFVR